MINFLNAAGEHWWSWQIAMLWQTAVLIGILWIVDVCIRKWAHPQVRYALWMLVLVKLLIPPTWTSPASVTSHIPGLAQKAVTSLSSPPAKGEYPKGGRGLNASSASVPDNTQHLRNTKVVEMQTSEQPRLNHPGLTATPPSKGGELLNGSPSSEGEVHQLVASKLVSEDGRGEGVAASMEGLHWQVYAMFTWLAGMIVLSTWLILRLTGLRREHQIALPLPRGSTPKGGGGFLPERFYQQLESVAAKLRLKRIPQVILTDKVACPAVFGVFRPVLLMPAKKFKTMSTQDTEHILLHELAHIKRGDLLVHAVWMLAQIVYWFNPLLWMARRPMQNLRELCCDATVARLLRDKTYRYRETLLETARQLLAEPVDPGLGLLGLFENNNWLVTRLRWLEKNTWKNRPLRIATIIVLVAIMTTCVLPMANRPAAQESRRVKALAKIIQEDRGEGRAKAADDLIKEIENKKTINISAQKALEAIINRIIKHPKTTDRDRKFDSYPKIYWGEIGLGFKLIANEKVNKDQSEDFLQALELIGCTYGVEHDGVFRLFGQLTAPRNMVANYKLQTLTIDGKEYKRDLLDVFPKTAGGGANWGRETTIKLDPEQSLELQLDVAWYQIPDSMVENLPDDWRDKDEFLRDVIGDVSVKKLCEYTQKLELSHNSKWQGIFGDDFSNNEIQNSDFTARLDNGVSVELVGICEHPSEGEQWWEPDGSLLAESPHGKIDVGSSVVSKGKQTYEFDIRLRGSEDILNRSDTPDRWSVPKAQKVGLGRSGSYPDKSGKRCLRITTAQVKKDIDTIDINYGLAGQWEKLVSISANTFQAIKHKETGLVVKPPYEENGRAVITIKVPNKTDKKMAVKVCAVLENGDRNWNAARSRDGGFTFLARTDNYEFTNLKLSKIKQFEIYTSEYEWVTFKNVSLRPSRKLPDVTLTCLSWQPLKNESKAPKDRVYWTPAGEIVNHDSLPERVRVPGAFASIAYPSKTYRRPIRLWFTANYQDLDALGLSVNLVDYNASTSYAEARDSKSSDGVTMVALATDADQPMPQQADLHVSYAIDNWETIAEFDTKKGAVNEHEIVHEITWSYKPASEGLKTILLFEAEPDHDKVEYRQVLVGNEDKKHSYVIERTDRQGIAKAVNYKGLKPSDLRKVKIQKRSRTSKVIKDVSLRLKEESTNSELKGLEKTATEQTIIDAIKKSLPDNYFIKEIQRNSWPNYFEKGNGIALHIAEENIQYRKQQYSGIVCLMPKDYTGKSVIKSQGDPHGQQEPLSVFIAETKNFRIFSSPGLRDLAKKIAVVIEKTENEITQNPELKTMSRAQSRDQNYTATLPNGAAVELVGLCSTPGSAKWWNPAGIEIPEPQYRAETHVGTLSEEYGCSILAKTNAAKDAFVVFRLPSGYLGGSGRFRGGDFVLGGLTKIPLEPIHDSEKANIGIGVAQGTWINTGVELENKPDAGPVTIKLQDEDTVVVDPLTDGQGVNGHKDTTVLYGMPSSVDYEFRAEFTTKDGSVLPNWSGTSVHARKDKPEKFLLVMENIGPKEIVSFRLFYRKIEWTEFKNVALRPGNKTEGKVLINDGQSQNDTLLLGCGGTGYFDRNATIQIGQIVIEVGRRIKAINMGSDIVEIKSDKSENKLLLGPNGTGYFDRDAVIQIGDAMIKLGRRIEVTNTGSDIIEIVKVKAQSSGSGPQSLGKKADEKTKVSSQGNEEIAEVLDGAGGRGFEPDEGKWDHSEGIKVKKLVQSELSNWAKQQGYNSEIWTSLYYWKKHNTLRGEFRALGKSGWVWNQPKQAPPEVFLNVDKLKDGIWYLQGIDKNPTNWASSLRLELLIPEFGQIPKNQRTALLDEARKRFSAVRIPNPKWTRTLPNGVIVEFAGITEFPDPGRQWWAPDGKSLGYNPAFGLCQPDAQLLKAYHFVNQTGKKRYEAAFAISWPKSPNESKRLDIFTDNLQVLNRGGCLAENEVVTVPVRFANNQKTFDVTLKIATDGQNLEEVTFKNASLRPGGETEQSGTDNIANKRLIEAWRQKKPMGFGPVYELKLILDESGQSEFLDLQNARTVQAPVEIDTVTDRKQLKEWAVQHKLPFEIRILKGDAKWAEKYKNSTTFGSITAGFELSSHDTQMGTSARFPVDQQTIKKHPLTVDESGRYRVDVTRFDTMFPRDIMKSMFDSSWGTMRFGGTEHDLEAMRNQSVLFDSTVLPAIIQFWDFHGQLGLLHIQSYDSQKRELHLRWKLVNINTEQNVSLRPGGNTEIQ